MSAALGSPSVPMTLLLLRAQSAATCAGCADPINHPHAFDCTR